MKNTNQSVQQVKDSILRDLDTKYRNWGFRDVLSMGEYSLYKDFLSNSLDQIATAAREEVLRKCDEIIYSSRNEIVVREDFEMYKRRILMKGTEK